VGYEYLNLGQARACKRDLIQFGMGILQLHVLSAAHKIYYGCAGYIDDPLLNIVHIAIWDAPIILLRVCMWSRKKNISWVNNV
jgi:hypothetical protein